MSVFEEREWASLRYWNPEILLTRLLIPKAVSESRGLPKKIRHWNAQPLKKYKEQEQAALFCYCVDQLCRVHGSFEVAMAPRRDADYDCVLREEMGSGKYNYKPVQLKELVHQEVNPAATLQDILDRLRAKYPVSNRLLVAVYINRDVVIDLSKVRVLPLTVEQVWLYGVSTTNQIAVSAFRSDGIKFNRVVPYPPPRFDLLKRGR